MAEKVPLVKTTTLSPGRIIDSTQSSPLTCSLTTLTRDKSTASNGSRLFAGSIFAIPVGHRCESRKDRPVL